MKILNNSKARFQIVSALTWAVTMIACSLVLTGSSDAAMINNILICGASVHLLYLASLEQDAKDSKGANC